MRSTSALLGLAFQERLLGYSIHVNDHARRLRDVVVHIIDLLNARVAKALQNGLSLSLFFVLWFSLVCYPQKNRVSNFGKRIRSTIKKKMSLS